MLNFGKHLGGQDFVVAEQVKGGGCQMIKPEFWGFATKRFA
jgi:hypothetical protein